jgi:glycosyltransferase involved in cell wall biosynthesis
MKDPEVSVVIATYNMGQHVRQAVLSVLAQSDQNLEVVVVDDGSTDNTREVLREFAEDSRVRILLQENQGQPKAKNAGWRKGRGRFIGFCDADDYWLPNKLALQLPLLRRDPKVGVVYSRAATLAADGTLLPPRKRMSHARSDVLERMFISNLVPFGTAVVRRECLEQVGGFNESIPMGIDWDLWLRIALDWEFDLVDEATYVYRVWPGQMSHNLMKRYECALIIMQRFLEAHPGRLPDKVISMAYADTYTNFAAVHFHQSSPAIKAGFGLLVRALACRPGFWPAWRLLLGLPYRGLRNLVRASA